MMCLHFIYFSVRANRTYQWCMLPQLGLSVNLTMK